MHLRYRVVPLLAALCLGFASAPALAAKPTPTVEPFPEGTTPQVIGNATGAAVLCVLGQSTVAASGSFFLPPDDVYFTFIDPATCGCPGGVDLTAAHWVLAWPTACTIPVEVSVVGAVETPEGSGCYVPNESDVIVSPISSSVVGVVGPPVDHTFALPPTFLTRKAFIRINMQTSGDCPLGPPGVPLTSPEIVLDNSPDLCVSYNIYPGALMADIIATYGFPGNTTMWLDTDCNTPTLPLSWGRVKTLYR